MTIFAIKRPWVLRSLLYFSIAATTSALAQAPAASSAPLQISADGQLVIDLRAKLAWPRCAEGMVLKEQNCTGRAEVFTNKQALNHAAERSKAEGLRWRLPRVNEFKRLLERNSKPQGLSPALFPNAPRDWHWTGTAAVNTQRINNYNYSQVDKTGSLSGLSAQQGWAINTETLEATPDMGKGNALLLRLVRPASEAELAEVRP